MTRFIYQTHKYEKNGHMHTGYIRVGTIEFDAVTQPVIANIRFDHAREPRFVVLDTDPRDSVFHEVTP